MSGKQTNYLEGDAVVIECEVDEDDVSGTVVYLESIFDPDGNEIESEQSMSFDLVETNVAKKTWQSTKGVDPVGRYEYVVRAENGSFKSYGRSFFFIEGRR